MHCDASHWGSICYETSFFHWIFFLLIKLGYFETTLCKLSEIFKQFLPFKMELLWDITQSRRSWGIFLSFSLQIYQAEPCFKRLLNLLSTHWAIKLVLRRLHFLSESFLNGGSCGCLLFFWRVTPILYSPSL